MIYDLVDMVDFVYCIFLDDCGKSIICPVLSFISRNKFHWFTVGGLFLYPPTNWYLETVVIFKAVIVELERTCN